jgi:hypothetical protein
VEGRSEGDGTSLGQTSAESFSNSVGDLWSLKPEMLIPRPQVSAPTLYKTSAETLSFFFFLLDVLFFGCFLFYVLFVLFFETGFHYIASLELSM